MLHTVMDPPYDVCVFITLTDRAPTFKFSFPLVLSLFAPEMLFSWSRFGIPLPRRPVQLPFPGRIWCLLAGAFLSLRFLPRRCCFCLPWSLGRTVRDVGLTKLSPWTPSGWCCCSNGSSLLLIASRFGFTRPGAVVSFFSFSANIGWRGLFY